MPGGNPPRTLTTQDSRPELHNYVSGGGAGDGNPRQSGVRNDPRRSVTHPEGSYRTFVRQKCTRAGRIPLHWNEIGSAGGDPVPVSAGNGPTPRNVPAANPLLNSEISIHCSTG